MSTTDFYQSCIVDRWQMKQLSLQTPHKTSKLVQFDSLCHNTGSVTCQRKAEECTMFWWAEERRGWRQSRLIPSWTQLCSRCTVVTGKKTREKVLKYRTSRSDTTPPVSVWQMSPYAFGRQPSQGLSWSSFSQLLSKRVSNCWVFGGIVQKKSKNRILN